MRPPSLVSEIKYQPQDRIYSLQSGLLPHVSAGSHRITLRVIKIKL